MDVMMAFLETLGTIAFAVSGAIEAIKKEMDLLGVLVLGVVTAIGGGVIRDVIIGQVPPAAFQNPTQTKVALATALMVFLLGMLVAKRHKKINSRWYNGALFMSDAIGLAAFTILGIRCVQEQLGSDNAALLMFVGVVTGVGGGLLRDLFAGNVPYIFHKHVYATASILGAAVYLFMNRYMPKPFCEYHFAIWISIGSVLLVRMLAAHYKWNLPKIKIYF